MRYTFLLCVILLVVSCSPTKLIYTTGSNMDDVSQVPITSKQKGDMNVEISGSIQSGYKSHSEYYYQHKHVIFKSIGNTLFNSKIHYSITDDFSIGVNYQRLLSNNDNLVQGHVIGPSINYSKNKYTSAQKAIYGFDILGSIQYRTANNAIFINEMHEGFLFFFPFYSEVLLDTISSVQIHQKLIKYMLQPSFSIEMKNFHLFFGASIVYQHQYRYSSPQLSPTQVQLENVEFEEPFAYYNRKKSEWAGHIFYGFGIGPSIARFHIKFAHVATTDPFNKGFATFNMGITSNFNVYKEGRQHPKFSPSRK